MRSRVRIPLLYLLPGMVALTAIVVFPIGFGLYTSLTSWNWAAGAANSMTFIGLGNYGTMLHDTNFWNSIWRTLYFTVGAVAVEFVLGLGCALLLNMKTKGTAFFRTAFVFPLMVSDIVAALMWKMLLNPAMGHVNYYLGVIGLGAPNWIGDPHLVIITAILIDVWWQTGNITLILLAGLKSIPASHLEAAQVDGASAWQRLRFVIIPWLRPVIFVALVFRTIACLRVFTIMWGVTGGGPGRASEVAQLYIYKEGLGRLLKMGYSASLAITFSLIIVILIGAYIRRLGRNMA